MLYIVGKCTGLYNRLGMKILIFQLKLTMHLCGDGGGCFEGEASGAEGRCMHGLADGEFHYRSELFCLPSTLGPEDTGSVSQER